MDPARTQEGWVESFLPEGIFGSVSRVGMSIGLVSRRYEYVLIPVGLRRVTPFEWV